jgi:hypothetical protein
VQGRRQRRAGTREDGYRVRMKIGPVYISLAALLIIVILVILLA